MGLAVCSPLMAKLTAVPLSLESSGRTQAYIRTALSIYFHNQLQSLPERQRIADLGLTKDSIAGLSQSCRLHCL